MRRDFLTRAWCECQKEGSGGGVGGWAGAAGAQVTGGGGGDGPKCLGQTGIRDWSTDG